MSQGLLFIEETVQKSGRTPDRLTAAGFQVSPTKNALRANKFQKKTYRSNWVFSNIISRTKFPGVPSFRVKRDVPEFTLRVSNFIVFSFKLMSVSGGTPLAPGKKKNNSIPRLRKRAPQKIPLFARFEIVETEKRRTAK